MLRRKNSFQKKVKTLFQTVPYTSIFHGTTLRSIGLLIVISFPWRGLEQQVKERLHIENKGSKIQNTSIPHTSLNIDKVKIDSHLFLLVITYLT